MKKAAFSQNDRRGEWAAILGMVVSVIGSALLATLSVYSHHASASMWGAAFQMFGAAGIWLLCYIQLHQRRLLAEEQLEVAELERVRRERLAGARTIFEEQDLEQMDALAMGRRIRTVERFLIPALALGVAIFHLASGVSLFPWLWEFPPLRGAPGLDQLIDKDLIKVQVDLFFAGGIAFVTFMLSRYALGLCKLHRFAALRAGGNFHFGSSMICLVIAIALLCEISGLVQTEHYLGRAVGALLVYFAVEALVNFILDFYRPRIAGEPQRPFYDSRLLGLFSEPGGIIRSVANTIDYQFGFKVSETWFYKLMGRAIPLLVAVQFAVILILTCFVVVPPGHGAVIERYGVSAIGAADQWVAGPGVHLTLPWPIDRAEIIPVERIRRMELGYSKAEEPEKDEEAENQPVMDDRPPILWTKRHYQNEYKLLLAQHQSYGAGARRTREPGKEPSPDAQPPGAAPADAVARPGGEARRAGDIPVNLLSVTMSVQWRVKPGSADVLRFYAESAQVPEIIESLAYQELTRYAASADIEDFLGTEGIRAAGALHDRIQSACDRAGHDGGGLGVQIVYVGIGGVHPPPEEEVAQAYQDVVSAIEKKEAKRMEAEGDADKLRIESGGIHWERLYDAIVAEDQARAADAADLPEKTAEVERLLREVAGGWARVVSAEAEQRLYARLYSERAAAESYAMQIEAFEAAPHSYRLRVYLRMIVKALGKVRKYILLLEDPGRVMFDLDLTPPRAVDILGAELRAAEKKSQ